MSDLEQIVDGVEPEETTAAEPVVEETTDETPEVVAEPEESEPVVEPEVKPEATVPLAALLEVRQELQQLKSLATPKPQPVPAPDVFEDPQGYQKHMQTELRNATTQAKLEMSRFMAEEKFGKEQVDAMVEYYNQHPEKTAAFLNAPSPFHAGMAEYNSARVAQEIGNDPAAFKEKMKAELRAELQAEMVTKQARDKAGQFAPSMANVTGTGGGSKSTWTGPAPLDSILGE